MGGGEREGERREDGRVRGGESEGGWMGWWGGGRGRKDKWEGGKEKWEGGKEIKRWMEICLATLLHWLCYPYYRRVHILSGHSGCSQRSIRCGNTGGEACEQIS